MMWNLINKASSLVILDQQLDQPNNMEDEEAQVEAGAEANATGENPEQQKQQTTNPEQQEESTIPTLTTDDFKQAASTLGSYLSGVATFATTTALKVKDIAADQIEKNILTDFEEENKKFREERELRRIIDGTPPWCGFQNESQMKTQILALSAEERNFLRSPPSGVDFEFDLKLKMPAALATLKEDENLAKMRFALVPKKVKETEFWRNYFYRVSLIVQSVQLSSVTEQPGTTDKQKSAPEGKNMEKEGEDSAETSKNEESTTSSPTENENEDESLSTDGQEDEFASEFVSDSFQEEYDISDEELNQMIAEENQTPLPEDDEYYKTIDQEIMNEMENFEMVDTTDLDEN